MKQCPLIEDLLPLYVDDAVSPESRTLVEEHLQTCADCRLALEALQACPALGAPSPDDAAPSDDARFITRLKRQVGTVIGLSLLLVVAIAYGSSQYGHWRADQAFGKRMETQEQEKRAALAALRQASPDPMARLKAAGVDLTYKARLAGGDLLVDYTLTADPPAAVAMPMGIPGDSTPRLLDLATGKDVGRFYQGGAGHSPGQPVQGDMRFALAGPLPGRAAVQFDDMFVFLKPDRELKWEIRRPGEEGDVLIGQRFTAAGVEFEVERVRFVGERVQIDYRQVTPTAQVGLYLLSFRLSDRMGGHWGGDGDNISRLPDPLRPSRTFELVASLSKNWVVEVQYAVLAVPGPTLPVEVN